MTRMKLQAVHDGRLYTTAGRTVYRETDPFDFERVGSIPVVDDGVRGLKTRLQTANPWKSALETAVGSYQTANLWALSGSNLLATAGRYAFASRDGGRSWTPTLALHPSSVRMGVLPTCVCTHEGATYLAEYPLSESATPRVFRSDDDGATWEPYVEADVRHFHSVTVDPYEGDLWLTTGDRDEECRFLRVSDGELETVGGGSQRWRAVEPVFTREAILWGMDCGYAEENELYKLPRSEVTADDPTPERVGAVDSSVYYAECLTVNGAEWVVFATAAETGGDRTAPPGADAARDRHATVVAASSESGFTDWSRLATYPRRTALADRAGSVAPLPAANAYVLLDSDPERGLFLNPFNTATDDGRVRRVPKSAFPE